MFKYQTLTYKGIELPENPANTYARHTETLDSCSTSLGVINSIYRDLHRWWSNQRPQSRNSTTEPQSISHTNDAISTSHDNCVANWPECILQVTSVLFAVDAVTSRATFSQED